MAMVRSDQSANYARSFLVQVPVDSGSGLIYQIEAFREAVQLLAHRLSPQFTIEEIIDVCETAVVTPIPEEWKWPSG